MRRDREVFALFFFEPAVDATLAVERIKIVNVGLGLREGAGEALGWTARYILPLVEFELSTPSQFDLGPCYCKFCLHSECVRNTERGSLTILRA